MAAHGNLPRRALLAIAGSLPGAAPVAGPHAPRALPGAGAPNDAVLSLSREMDWLEMQGTALAEAHGRLRAEFVARWGDLPGDPGTSKNWQRDPDRPRLDALLTRLDAVNDEQADMARMMVTTPAATLAGLLCKVRHVLAEWPGPRSGSARTVYDHFALATLRDAERVLERLLEGGA